MKANLTMLGILIIACGIFALSQIVQRAQARLPPEMLAKIVAQKSGGWAGFLLPLAPMVVALLLMDYFPDRQGWIAVPAMLLGYGLLVRDFVAGARRTRELGLPADYLAEVRRANLVFLASLLLGGGLLLYLHWHRFFIPVSG